MTTEQLPMLDMKYFVLKPRGSTAYASASRRAMWVYADNIREVNPVFADQLTRWADRELLRVKE